MTFEMAFIGGIIIALLMIIICEINSIRVRLENGIEFTETIVTEEDITP